MRKLLLLIVSLFMIASSYAGKWTGNATYNVSEDGNMRCYSSDTKSLETGEVSGGSFENSITVNTDVASDISVTISGDSHFQLLIAPTSTRTSGYYDYAYEYIYYTFDASDLAPNVTPYTATITITRGDQEVTCSLSATVTGEPAPTAGAILNGEFSVSATKKVKFTRGNLYWNGSDWAIESAQTRFRKSWSANHVSHFFWANTAEEARAESMTSSLSENDVLFCDGSDAEHMISAESADNLYALSSAEWNYLISGRANASNLYRYPVQIGQTNGYFVIAPDDYDGTVDTYYTEEDFLTAQENGLVCITQAGRREGTTISQGDAACWTSTMDASSYGNAAYLMNAHNAYIAERSDWEDRVEIASYIRNYYQGPGYGFALRLVQNVSGEGEGGEEGGDDPEVNPITASLIIATEKPVSFSVSGNKKVQFTRGNLFWDGENWNAEATQYDFPTTYSSTHVGHFFWMQNATDAYAENYNSSNANAYDNLFCDADHSLTIKDANGDDIDGLYNMSMAEWQYLLGNSYDSRANATNLHKYPVTVAGHEKCLILAPDGFTGAIEDSYTADEWAEIEHAKGLVCLPMAGTRLADYFSDVDNNLNYWVGEGYNAYNAYKLEATEYSVFGAQTSLRQYGLPIRLVKEYNDPDLVPMPASEPVLSGVFRVNHNKYVKFTRGNLYWDGDWKLESQQNYRPSAIDYNHLGFFYWTTDATDAHAMSYPNVVKNVNDNFFCDGTDEEHMLTVEGQNNLFSLSDNEWIYLLNNRGGFAKAQTLHRFPVTVSGVPNCIVIAPDNFEGTLKDSYSREEFIAAQEEGIVCLPPTGYNYSSSYLSYMDRPYYWTATPEKSRDTYARQMYAYMSGEDGYVSNASAGSRSYRLPIRLVQEHVYPTCEYKIKVKVPESEGEDYIPGISGSFNGFKVDRLIPTNEPGWYTYTIKEPQSENTGVFFITEYKVSGDVGSNHVRSGYTIVPGTEHMAKYFEYSCNEGETFVEDLSAASWSSYSYHQGVNNRVREIHFYLDKPTVGATIPTSVSVVAIKQDGKGERTEERGNITISKSGNSGDSQYTDGHYYYFSTTSSGLSSFGTRTNTRYFWHLGDVVEETSSYTPSPTFRISNVELTRNLEDVTLEVSDNCTLSAIGDASDGHTFSHLETSAWRIFIDGEWENAHFLGKFNIFDIQHDNHNASLSFPATALPAGEYKFSYQYGASVDGNIFDAYTPATYGYNKYIDSHEAVVTIKEGTMVNTGAGPALAKRFAVKRAAAMPLSVAPVSYDYITGTTILTNVVTDANDVESVVRNNEKGATIKLDGTNTLGASSSGIETAESIVVQGAAGQSTISAPNAIYTPRNTADVVLTLSNVNLELIGQAGTSVISGFSNIVLDGCEIISPDDARYDKENRMLVDGSGNAVTNAVIRRAAPDYERAITNTANVGTICLPYAVAEGDYAGATFYELVSYADNMLVFEQVSSLEAGMPYVFLPEEDATSITCYYSGEEALTANHKNGLYGSYTRELIGGNQDNYVIVSNQCRQVGANTYVGANRAYIKLSEVPTVVAPKPLGARIISIVCDEESTTDIIDVESESGDEKTVKRLKDNQIMIIGNGEIHSVDGKRIK